jgi:hypothetical protein
MIRDFVMSLISFFVIDPFRAELNGKLAQVGAPAAVVAEVQACARAAAPALIERATTDWWWTGTTLISVGVGMTTPEQVLVQAVPNCAGAGRAAQPFLTAARA